MLMPARQPRIIGPVQNNRTDPGIATDEPAFAAEDLEALLESMDRPARRRDVRNRPAIPSEEDIGCIEVPDLAQRRIHIAIELGMRVIGKPANQPDQLIEIVHHHVRDDIALMRDLGAGSEPGVAAHLQDMLRPPDLSGRHAFPHFAPIGVKPAMKAEDDGQRSGRDGLDRLKDRLATEGDGFLAQCGQAKLACPQNVAYMGCRRRCDDQGIRPRRLDDGIEVEEIRN